MFSEIWNRIFIEPSQFICPVSRQAGFDHANVIFTAITSDFINTGRVHFIREITFVFCELFMYVDRSA